MKISVVLPFYNEAPRVKPCLEHIVKNNYQDPYEILVIDDGSTDNTVEMVEQFKEEHKEVPLRLLKHKTNQGRATTRLNCAKNAKYDNLLFVDGRARLFPDLMDNLKKINYSPAVARVLLDEEGESIDRFFQICRRKAFSSFMKEEDKLHYITSENFDEKPKGTTIFFCTKKLFIESQFKDVDNVYKSDDTMLLYNISQRKPIMRHPDIKIFYDSRKELKHEIKHTFFRGPKFIDYYFRPGKRYYRRTFLLLAILLLLFVNLTLLPLVSIKVFLLFLSSAIIAFILLAIWIAEKPKDVPIILFYGPIMFSAFIGGMLWGIRLKLLKKL